MGDTNCSSMQGPFYRPMSGGVKLDKCVVCGHGAPNKMRPLYKCRWYTLVCLPLPAWPLPEVGSCPLNSARAESCRAESVRADFCPTGLNLAGLNLSGLILSRLTSALPG